MPMSIYKVRVSLEQREDGGLRAWSDDVPELVLSHADPDAVLSDIPEALAVILGERLGRRVEIAQLELLPSGDSADAPSVSREFAARVAA